MLWSANNGGARGLFRGASRFRAQKESRLNSSEIGAFKKQGSSRKDFLASFGESDLPEGEVNLNVTQFQAGTSSM